MNTVVKEYQRKALAFYFSPITKKWSNNNLLYNLLQQAPNAVRCCNKRATNYLTVPKLISFISAGTVLLLLFSVNCYASTAAVIGLTGSSNTVSSSAITVSLGYGEPAALYLNSESGFSVSVSVAYSQQGAFASYATALEASNLSGGIPGFNGSNWTVYSQGNGSGQTFIIKSGSTASVAFSAETPPFIQGNGGITSVSGKLYRGYIKPILESSGIALVNVIDTEEYLYSVVPSEMPALWHVEALKAQAVAARTYYLYSRTRSHSSSGYELCDTIHCQVYNGTQSENINSTSAVDQTQGISIYYDNEPIDALFSSSSGGYTENSENVWSGTLPYLRSVKEIAEKEYMEWTRTYTFEQLSAGLAANGASVGSLNSITVVYRPTGRAASITFNGSNGSKTYEKDSIRSFPSKIDSSLPSIMFTINGQGMSAGSVNDVVAQTNDQSYDTNTGSSLVYISGTVNTSSQEPTGLYTIDGNGTIAMTGSWGMSAISGDGIIKMLSPTQNVQAQPPSSTAQGDEETVTITTPTIVLNGKGYGHGVGMSQYGAKGMAEEGYTYTQILKHYYTGVDVR